MKVLFGLSRVAYRLGSSNAVVRLFAEAGRGGTVLHHAVWADNLEVVRALVEDGGADITLRNAMGFTALRVAEMRYGQNVPVEMSALLRF